MKLGRFQDSREGNLVPLLDEIDRRARRQHRDNLKALVVLGILVLAAWTFSIVWSGS